MHEQEGVIKFNLEWETAPPLTQAQVSELCAWRNVLVQMQMIGQTPERYGGLGFGNISRRFPLADAPDAFLISGTQTGGLPTLLPEHVATVVGCDAAQNRVVARGAIRPSSEAMTHAVLYALSPNIEWVLHAHDPTIWHAAEPLNLPATRADVPYGTPEMSAEVARLFAETAVSQTNIFTMRGHEDGVVAFGKTASEAVAVLVETLAVAFKAAS